VPVLTVIAGPNGSGKSTLIASLVDQGVHLGTYFNADDIAKELSGPSAEVAMRAQEMVRAGRAEALSKGASHSFETVISHVEYMRDARAKGFEVRLFFLATDKPEINLERVSNRVKHGGHDVPADRVQSRYHRCLQNLPAAIAAANHSLIFDNSQAGRSHRLLAEVKNNRLIHKDVSSFEIKSGKQSVVKAPQILPELIPSWWLEVLLLIKPDKPLENGLLK
jgi:predicted ABC-type ATPase